VGAALIRKDPCNFRPQKCATLYGAATLVLQDGCPICFNLTEVPINMSISPSMFVRDMTTMSPPLSKQEAKQIVLISILRTSLLLMVSGPDGLEGPMSSPKQLLYRVQPVMQSQITFEIVVKFTFTSCGIMSTCAQQNTALSGMQKHLPCLPCVSNYCMLVSFSVSHSNGYLSTSYDSFHQVSCSLVPRPERKAHELGSAFHTADNKALGQRLETR